MFHATIHTPSQGTFRFSGRVAPYDLEMLREHVCARGGRGTRVEVRLAPEERPALLVALRGVDRRGIEIVLAG